MFKSPNKSCQQINHSVTSISSCYIQRVVWLAGGVIQIRRPVADQISDNKRKISLDFCIENEMKYVLKNERINFILDFLGHLRSIIIITNILNMIPLKLMLLNV